MLFVDECAYYDICETFPTASNESGNTTLLRRKIRRTTFTNNVDVANDQPNCDRANNGDLKVSRIRPNRPRQTHILLGLGSRGAGLSKKGLIQPSRSFVVHGAALQASYVQRFVACALLGCHVLCACWPCGWRCGCKTTHDTSRITRAIPVVDRSNSSPFFYYYCVWCCWSVHHFERAWSAIGSNLICHTD